jgi:excisionase family DNA binding protein
MKEEKVINVTLKDVKWVARYLSTSRNTIHEWVNDNHIPYINLGVPGGRRVIRFDQNAIDAWLSERSQAAVNHPVEEKPEVSEQVHNEAVA